MIHVIYIWVHIYIEKAILGRKILQEFINRNTGLDLKSKYTEKT